MTDLDALRAVEQRVLWLATRIIDAANHDRENPQGIKVGGHQASSASMVSMMTVLWFAHLRADDRVSVKPHASPVLHAINYLLGRLDRRYLTELRSFGGLQAYPSRTKDPDPVDFSTGSVGLGATAPLFAAAARRYLDLHFGEQARGARFVALMGDAELDEGHVGGLGGHGLEWLLEAYATADASPDQPSVVFAYTVKGWGLPFAGDPMNHSAIMSAEQIAEFRGACGLDVGTEWDQFGPRTKA